MRLRLQYLIFVLILHGLFFLVSLQLLPDKPGFFLLIECLILVSLGFSAKLFRSFIAPIDLITNGIEAIKSRDFNTTLVEVGQGEMDQLIIVYNQMINELRGERVKQQEQQFFLDKLVEASPAGIIILSLDGNILSLNPFVARLLEVDRDQARGQRLAEMGQGIASKLAKLLPGETVTLSQEGRRFFKCQKSHFLDQGFQRHFILIEELTEELIKREKQTYGKIIRFMSHEIRNSIGAINSILNSVLNYGNQLDQNDAEDFKGAVDVAITRNNHLNQFMQNYAQIVRLPPPALDYYDLHELLKGIEVLFFQDCQKLNIEWKWQLATQDEFTCNFDKQQLEQALINIIKNAMEAIGENGRLQIITEAMPKRVLLVRDTGAGFNEEERGQLFTPFFSTKKDGQGVGLIMIRDILMNHGFNFSLTRLPDNLTEFRIEF
ncbi:MAG: PAS domain-containing protein [FCB group bacterium]|nr:PAS domain-containing protein [FCB group bacterium]